MKKVFARLNWIASIQFGMDVRKLFGSLRGIPRYLRDLYKFRSNYFGKFELVPCLHDWYEEGGATKNEYFWQDLLVARKIFYENPETHVDIGSRVDGFVAHVASFREIEVFDVRPLTTQIPGIKFKQADLMAPINELRNYCDSLSCLHALEHFGLGRYGDPIDPSGFERGLVNMASLVKANGLIYLSVPVGVSRVEFNANRVFDPRVIVDLADKNFMKLIDFVVIRQGGEVTTVSINDLGLDELAMQRYNLGIFTFVKCTELTGV